MSCMAYYLVDDAKLVELCDGETLWKLCSGNIQLVQIVTCNQCEGFNEVSQRCNLRVCPVYGERISRPDLFFCGYCKPKSEFLAWQQP